LPIYEFRCTNCDNIQEFILTGSSDTIEMKCGECGGESLERIMSRSNFSMGSSGSSGCSGPSATSRSCGPGKSCTSIELPGHTK
jgi:putative FmdB family regulatory protein